jgi:uncharacterized membrane protein YgcG
MGWAKVKNTPSATEAVEKPSFKPLPPLVPPPSEQQPPAEPTGGEQADIASPGPLATAPPIDLLAPYEKNLLNLSFESEPLTQRLERLESFVLGAPQTGDPQVRQSNLLSLLAKIDQAKQDGATPEAASTPASPVANSPAPSKPDATDYPTITAMEKSTFGADFRNEPIQSRLARLETQLLGRPFPNKDLVDRVDTLNMKAPTRPGSGHRIFADNSPSGTSSRQSSDLQVKLSTLERFTFNGQTFPDRLMSERLDKLEREHFGSMFSHESVDARVNRLLNGFQQSTARGGGRSAYPTASQPNYPAPPQVASPPAASASRQNIRIGSSIGSTSSHQYSQDLMDMLPNDLRYQMQGGQVGGMGGMSSRSSSYSGFSQGGFSGGGFSSRRSSSGVVGAAPGTVIIEEQTTMHPNFQTFSNPAQQSRNLFTQPGGTALGMPGAVPMNPMGQGMMPQAMVPGMGMVDPGVLQLLNNLEMQTFGQVNPYAPVPMRLSQLEASLLGQNLTGHSDVDRLNNLQRATQMQGLGRALGNGRLGQVGRTAGSLLFGVPMPPPAR